MTLERIVALVNKQAEDHGLWFMAQTAAEAYLQQELRSLHTLIELEAGAEEAENNGPVAMCSLCGSYLVGTTEEASDLVCTERAK